MEKSIINCMKDLNRDYIDIFHLHAARIRKGNVLEERAGAWKCLIDYKQKGYIRAIGVATHLVNIVDYMTDEPELDVIFPLVNKFGIGIEGGSVDDMLTAMAKAQANGKGIYTMKLLGGGNFLDKYKEVLEFGRSISGVTAHAIGMVSKEELGMNLRFFNDEPITEQEYAATKNKKQIHVSPHLCKRCGVCVETCPSFAMTLVEGTPEVDYDKCLLCAYCAAACPEFAIRVK